MNATTKAIQSFGHAQRVASRASMAREQAARDLAAAQAAGASVRELARLLDVQPTTVQRLIASAKS